ncbi:MAG: ABC transporter ATP-binding protein [Actinobacteria bacterium]|nr:MAG: ABC transporter ATP-binding protein [Actinomycetota bacterium]
MSDPVLELEELAVEFSVDDGVVHAVNGVSVHVDPGETLAIVGESGSGKTVAALAVMGLIPPPGRIVGGDVRLLGRALVGLREREYRKLRGADIAMIFQDPLSSLNPAFRVGDQIAEALTVHGALSKRAARQRATELLDLVGIPQPEVRDRYFPHQLSGGMRQRAMIAMAIANSPKLLIADEPTTALDVTVQAQVLEVLRAAQREVDAALLLITHDLGIVAGTADRVAVMYAGRIVEDAGVDELFTTPRHPYTRALLASLPRVDAREGERLQVIPGVPPNPLALPDGCAFAPRCAFVVDACRDEVPALRAVEDGRLVRCVRVEELDGTPVAEDAPAVSWRA